MQSRRSSGPDTNAKDTANFWQVQFDHVIERA
jgi:hypothetical protein